MTVSAGRLRADPAQGWVVPHAWTPDGVVVRAEGTGAHVLHLSVALCVLNDTFREAEALGLPVEGARVVAQGSLDTESWVSTGITYAVDVDSTVPLDLVAKLLARVDEVAEIPQALRTGMSVERTHG